MSRRCDQQRGLTLIELLIGMSIGLIVVGAVVQALVHTSRHYRRAETLSQMQEVADVALRFLRDDLRMAGHWGLTPIGVAIDGRATPLDDNPSGLQLPPQCAAAITTRLNFPVELYSGTASWGCAATNVAIADGVVVRFASASVATPQAGRLQVDSNPLSARLIDDGVTAVVHGAPNGLHDLQVMAYYVAPRSSVFTDQPVLKRVTLNATTLGPRYIDEEITAGVEALQVSVDVDSDGDRIADRTLQAGDAALLQADASGMPALTPLAVNVSLIVRSETGGWRPGTTQRFRIGDLDWLAPADGYLRLSATQSIALRNPVLR